jgi:hypothetical protein
MACPGQFASWRALGREATRLCEPSAQGRPPLLGCPVHPALADEQSNEVPGDHHHRPASHAVVDVAPATKTPRPRSRRGYRTTPPAATPSCGSGSSWPTWAWPTGWPGGSATAAGPAPRTWSRPIGPGRSPPSTATTPATAPVRPLRRGLCGRQAQMPPARHQLAAPYCPAAQGTIPAAVPGSR